MKLGMGAAGAGEGNFAKRVKAIARIAAGWEGYFVETVSRAVNTVDEDLTICFADSRPAPYLPVCLRLARIRFLEYDDLDRDDMPFVDEVKVTWLPADRTRWPVEARNRVKRTAAGATELVWVKIAGPWPFEAVAQIIDVMVTPPEFALIEPD